MSIALLLPVLQIMGMVLVGFLIGKLTDIADYKKALSTITLYAFNPALVFKSIYQAQASLQTVLAFMAVLALCLGAALLMATALSRPLNLTSDETAAFRITSAFGNIGNIGFPLILFAFGDQGAAIAAFGFVFSSLTVNSLGVYIASLGMGDRWLPLKNVLKMPATYALLLALLCKAFPITVPKTIMDPLVILAGGMVPTLLILLGIQLTQVKACRSMKPMIPMAFLKLVFMPFLAWLLVKTILPLPTDFARVVFVMAGTPSAINSNVLLIQFDRQAHLAAAGTMITTLLSMATLPMLLWLSLILF